MSDKIEKIFEITDVDPLLFYGTNDRNFKIIEKYFPVELVGRGNQVKIYGMADQVSLVEDLFSELTFLINKNKTLTRGDLVTAIQIIKGETGTVTAQEVHTRQDLNSVVVFTENGYIKPRGKGQSKYFKSVEQNDIVFCIGPAGTGKTYLAVAMAVAFLKSKLVSKIVLARPAVEAGESLGFLPGDFKEKIDPYLKPLYDALTEILPRDEIKKYLEQETIEVIPMAYMRGRTLNNAFVLLDEAQNCTFLQMKMFLTRLGVNSKAVINGDVTQIDLPVNTASGLVDIENILGNIDGIEFIRLDTQDVVRHKLVRKIIDAYSQLDATDTEE